MGMFDEIFIVGDIIERNKISCPDCKGLMKSTIWQTKDLECCMDQYCMALIESGNAKLFSLGAPSSLKFWHEYTQEELNIINEKHHNEIFCDIEDMQYGGYWEKEAYLPENRVWRDMGELPHKYVHLIGSCENCQDKNIFVQLTAKFTDGILVSLLIGNINS